jgi:hypothetical protein
MLLANLRIRNDIRKEIEMKKAIFPITLLLVVVCGIMWCRRSCNGNKYISTYDFPISVPANAPVLSTGTVQYIEDSHPHFLTNFFHRDAPNHLDGSPVFPHWTEVTAAMGRFYVNSDAVQGQRGDQFVIRKMPDSSRAICMEVKPNSVCYSLQEISDTGYVIKVDPGDDDRSAVIDTSYSRIVLKGNVPEHGSWTYDIGRVWVDYTRRKACLYTESADNSNAFTDCQDFVSVTPHPLAYAQRQWPNL